VVEHSGVAQPRKLVGGTIESAGKAVRMVEHGATVVLGVHVTRALYGRWRRMSAAARQRLEPLAEEVKGRALDLRGLIDPADAERDLREANERFAEAMVETAAADPEVSEAEVRELRADLARELERLATAEISAARGPAVRQDPP
jgi:hypothetical protein